MSDQHDFDKSVSNRTTAAPYTPQHPVPTVQGYESHLDHRNVAAIQPSGEVIPKDTGDGGRKLHALVDSAKTHLGLDSASKDKSQDESEIYRSQNRNIHPSVSQNGNFDARNQRDSLEERDEGRSDTQTEDQTPEEASQATANGLDPRQKRKKMKHATRDSTGREVTDPVTHLPVTIHDSSNNELKNVPENLSPSALNLRSSLQLSSASRSEIQLDQETQQSQAEHKGMENLFPPPNFQAVQAAFTRAYSLAVSFGLGCILVLTVIMLVVSHLISVSTLSGRDVKSSISWSRFLISSATIILVGIGTGGGLVFGVRAWLKKRIGEIWEDQIWDAARVQEEITADSPIPESTQWLNSLLTSVWALINPDLFTSLADTLEDVMQASLPKLVRMISVEDLGQGSEAIRILGIRWLPRGAAAKDVSVNGKLKSRKKNDESDRKVPGEGEIDGDTKSKGGADHNQTSKQDEEEESKEDNIAEGMEAEEGDFVNLEVAFSYRASGSGKSLKVKSKNAHLFLAFYLPGGIRFRRFPTLLLSLPLC